MVTLFDNPYIVVRHDEAKDTVWVERTSATSRDPSAATEVLAGVEKALLTIVAAKSTLVFDARKAQGRNDEAFEKTVMPKWFELTRLFRRRATIVSTPVGVLQSQRLNREAHIDAATFTDEGELEAWLSRGG
ncbi:MAG: hypothetical protein HOV80_11945 [Polyangiaceae bacterium]|nr:hypothetical protein [Polyangiaceae bacterium]